MLFCSRYKNYCLYCRPATERVATLLNGTSERIVVEPSIVAQFRLGRNRTDYEILYARRAFESRLGGEAAWGAAPLPVAVPATIDGVMTMTEPYRIDDNLSWLDTSDIGDAEERELVEQTLLGNHDLGIAYVLIEAEKIPAPWPNYDSVARADSIAKKVAEDGYDVAAVIAYERAHKNRQAVVDALEALRSQKSAAAAEADALSADIG